MQYRNNKRDGKIISLAEKHSARRQHLARLKFSREASEPKNYNIWQLQEDMQMKEKLLKLKIAALVIRKKIKIES